MAKTDNEADLRRANDASQTTSEPASLVRDAELALLLKEENSRLKEELKVLSRTLQIDAEEESAGGRKKSKRPASSSYDDGDYVAYGDDVSDDVGGGLDGEVEKRVQSALDAEEEPTGGRKKRKRPASSSYDDGEQSALDAEEEPTGGHKRRKRRVAPKMKVEETRMQRTCRLVSLVENFARPESLNAASALRVMDKLKDAALSLAELQESRAAKVVSDLRKNMDPSIASAAKQLRAHWKEAVAATVSMMSAPVAEGEQEAFVATVTSASNGESHTSKDMDMWIPEYEDGPSCCIFAYGDDVSDDVGEGLDGVEVETLDAEEEPTGGRKKRKRRASSAGDLTGDARSASYAMDMWIPEEENPSWLRIPVNSFIAGIKDADKAMFPTSIPSTTEARQPFLLTDFYAVGDMIRTAFKGRRNISFMNAAVCRAVFSDQGILREHNLSRSAKRINPHELTREDPVDM